MTRRVPSLVVALMWWIGTAGCSGTQSALAPAGPQAGAIARLWWFFFVVLSLVYVVVIVMTLIGVFRPRRANAASVCSMRASTGWIHRAGECAGYI